MDDNIPKYITIKLPKEMVKDIIDKILDIPNLGFSSRTEVVKVAIREYFEKLKDKKLL